MKRKLTESARSPRWLALATVAVVIFGSSGVMAAKPTWPAVLPHGAHKRVVTDESKDMLKPPSWENDLDFKKFTVAQTPPVVHFTILPEQDHRGNPWSDWGEGMAIGGKYYASAGDHVWEAYVYECDFARKEVRTVVDVKQFLNQPDGHYTPGKVHSRIDLGSDGWLYFATSRGSRRLTTDEYHYKGGWILKYHPKTGATKIVALGPVGKRSLPTSTLDADRMIMYVGTQQDAIFAAVDLKTGKTLYRSAPQPKGTLRYFIRSKTTGKVYFKVHGGDDPQHVSCYDPKTNKVYKIKGDLQIRSATEELPGGVVYCNDWNGNLYRFDVHQETFTLVGHLSIRRNGTKAWRAAYVASLDADPTGRYLYYTTGAHGGVALIGSPIIQYDTKTNRKKVIVFLNDYYARKYRYVPDGSFGSDVSEDGSTLYFTMNGAPAGEAGSSKNWWVCSVFAIKVPESERPLD